MVHKKGGGGKKCSKNQKTVHMVYGIPFTNPIIILPSTLELHSDLLWGLQMLFLEGCTECQNDMRLDSVAENLSDEKCAHPQGLKGLDIPTHVPGTFHSSGTCRKSSFPVQA